MWNSTNSVRSLQLIFLCMSEVTLLCKGDLGMWPLILLPGHNSVELACIPLFSVELSVFNRLCAFVLTRRFNTYSCKSLLFLLGSVHGSWLLQGSCFLMTVKVFFSRTYISVEVTFYMGVSFCYSCQTFLRLLLFYFLFWPLISSVCVINSEYDVLIYYSRLTRRCQSSVQWRIFNTALIILILIVHYGVCCFRQKGQ